jgi:membrane fusion protein (multidrug efflux system)
LPREFARTGSLLEADGFRGWALILIASTGLGAAWVWWFVKAEVPLYEVTGAARLETTRAAYVVQAPIDGKLVDAQLTVGRRVKEGDELAKVQSALQKLERGESRTRIGTIEDQVRSLREQLTLSAKAGEEEHRTNQSSIDVARSQLRSAEAPAAYLESESERVRKLHAQGLIAERDYQKVSSDLAAQRATVESLRLTIARLEREQRQRDSERMIRNQQTQSEITRLEGESRNIRASLDRLDYEIDRRVIRAPVDGVIGEAAVLRPGAFLSAGQKLTAIVPSGGTILVAQFPPASAMGRIRPGQRARIRMEGFPWGQYGSLNGTVERVASEVRDGTVRVELSIGPGGANIPLQHGMPGSVEIEVERLSPASLALRLAGSFVTSPRGRGEKGSNRGSLE